MIEITNKKKLNNLPIKPVYKDDGTSLPVVGKLNPVVLSEGKLSTDEENIFRELEKKNNVNVDLDDSKVIEFLKCRKNPFYFIHNYMQIEEVGGMTLFTPDKMNYKIRRYVKSLYKYHKGILLASRQLGKCLANTTKIPQIDGQWTTMGDLKIGDTILDNYGNPTKVCAITETYDNKKCYKVTFDAANSIIASDDHLWNICWTSFNKKNITITTEELKKIVESKIAQTSGRPYIEISKPIKNTKKEFHVDPYILGVWLGDGTCRRAEIAVATSDYEDFLNCINRATTKYKISEYRETPEKNSGIYVIYKLMSDLRKYDLYRNKHIPREYFAGSIYQRLQLIRGLMDTDGSCAKDGSCEFYQKDYRFILDVKELLSSLGIKSRLRKKIKDGETYHILAFSTRRFYVFNIKRKRERQKVCKNHLKIYRHYIKSIEPIESVPCRCIEVDSPDKLYLCGEDFVPTHNSTISAGIISHVMTCYPGQ